MDGAEARKLIALILVGMILAAAAAWMTSRDRSPSIDRDVPTETASSDPLKTEFERCQLLGEAGAHDPACLAAWAENRRRFLAPDRRPAAPNPAATSTATEAH
ncbi:MAG: hypothetical protein B7Y43_12515 [Sphingomonas sp. 28-62-20]|nr:MAG: hypothetical protein B7Y43_12515 [Sphingomonas sp. 28-62-20]